jgi:hypothetical protein
MTENQAKQVFVDESGRRARVVGLLARGLAVLLVAYLGLLVAGFLGASWVPSVRLPIVGDIFDVGNDPVLDPVAVASPSPRGRAEALTSEIDQSSPLLDGAAQEEAGTPAPRNRPASGANGGAGAGNGPATPAPSRGGNANGNGTTANGPASQNGSTNGNRGSNGNSERAGPKPTPKPTAPPGQVNKPDKKPEATPSPTA